MMRTTILVTSLLVSMLSASAAYAQKVEIGLEYGRYPIINCEGMPYTTTSKGTTEAGLKTAAANEQVYKRFAVHHTDNHSSLAWSDIFITCGNVGSYWRPPTQRELMLMWVLKDELNKKSGFTKFGAYYYWSATEHDSNNSWFVYFDIGSASYNYKTTGYRVRCIKEL